MSNLTERIEEYTPAREVGDTVSSLIDTLEKITKAISTIGEAIVGIDALDDLRDQMIRDLTDRVEALEREL